MRGKLGVFFSGILAFACCFHIATAAEVRLIWDPPTSSDGTLLEDVAGFLVYYGRESGRYTRSFDAGLAQTATIRDLDPHVTYYITVKAYSASGVESSGGSELRWAYDSDTNGLPDSWERRFLENVSEEQAGMDGDCDGDGVTNGAEFLAGTDPADPGGFPSVGIQVRQGSPRVTFPTRVVSGPGYTGKVRTYTVECCNDLSFGAWVPVGGCEGLPATGMPVDVPISTQDTVSRFYRLRVRLE